MADYSEVKKTKSKLLMTKRLQNPGVLVWLLISSLGCGQQEQSTPVASKDLPIYETWNATLVLATESRRNVVLKAGHISKYANTQTTHLAEGVTVQFFNQKGELSSTLTAVAGTIDETTRDMVAMGDVRVVTEGGVTLETDTLRWINKTETILTDRPVRVQTEQDLITGIGFESTPDLKHWVIRERVQGQFKRTLD